MTYDDLMDGRREQFELEYEAEAIRVRNEARTAFEKREAFEARRALLPATVGAGMYTSEPLPGVQSPFYAGERYYANAEDARRARMDLEAAPPVPAAPALPPIDALAVARSVASSLSRRAPRRDMKRAS